MKVSALVFALAISAADAFVAPKPASAITTSLQSSPQASPFNGGTDGSSNLPGQYGTVDIDNPYGGQQKYVPSGKKAINYTGGSSVGPANGGINGSSKLPGQYDTVNIDNPYGGQEKYKVERNRSVSEFSGGVKGVRGGPINGGTNGSSLMPERYETVSIDNPWGGKNPQAPMEYYSPQSTTQTIKRGILPATSAAAPTTRAISGVTGGAEGSSRIVDRGVVGIDAPWGSNQREG